MGKNRQGWKSEKIRRDLEEESSSFHHTADTLARFFDSMSLSRGSFWQYPQFPQYPQSTTNSSTQSQEGSWIDSIFGFGPGQQQQQFIDYRFSPIAGRPSSVAASTSSSYGREGRAPRSRWNNRGLSITSSHLQTQYVVPRFPRYGMLSRVDDTIYERYVCNY